MIRVATFNIRHGRGTDGKVDLKRIADVLETSGADIIGLNEVDRGYSKRSGYVDQAAWLAERLQLHYAFGAALNRKSRDESGLGQYGNALLSRYPIVSAVNHPLNSNNLMSEGRCLLECILLVHDRPYKIYVTHLSINPYLRHKQAAYIMKTFLRDRLPVILMGDWNMRSGGRRWANINKHLADVCFAAGVSPSRTFPSKRPTMQLDYIFASHEIRIASAEVLTNLRGASDHLPLQASFFLDDEQ